jgi:hypothetical protein
MFCGNLLLAVKFRTLELFLSFDVIMLFICLLIILYPLAQ